MIYDKANFYFHFSSFIVFLLLFCHNSSQLFSAKKSPWKVAFVLVEMENGGKIKEKVAYVLRARNFGVMIAS